MSETIPTELPYEILKIDERISLRQLHPEDSGDLFRLIDTNRDYLQKWLPWVASTNSPDDSTAFIGSMQKSRNEGTEYGYGIEVEGKLAGHTSLMHLKDGKVPEIGYWIASDMSGQGITTSVSEALTDFGFNTLGLEKITIKADPKNIPSNKIAEKLNYTLAGQEDHPQMGLANVWIKEKTR